MGGEYFKCVHVLTVVGLCEMARCSVYVFCKRVNNVSWCVVTAFVERISNVNLGC